MTRPGGTGDLTIVGGGREAWSVRRLGRGDIVRPRHHPAWVPGPSTSPLEPMKRYLIFGTSLLLFASAAAVGGYWLGFRHGSDLALMADAAPRGSLAIDELRWLENGKTASVRFYLESDVDSGLIWWHELDQFPLRRALNALSGADVIPGDEKYVRRLATYRKAHPSPAADASFNQRMLEEARATDPSFAKVLEEGSRKERQAIQEMLQKYGQ
jgi:hypothetical protein